MSPTTPARPHHAITAATALAVLLALTGLSARASETQAKAAGCTACHAVNSQVMGPSFREIAARYADKDNATSELAQHIREGGSGRWGAMPMPPQAQLSAKTLQALAGWIAAGAK